MGEEGGGGGSKSQRQEKNIIFSCSFLSIETRVRGDFIKVWTISPFYAYQQISTKIQFWICKKNQKEMREDMNTLNSELAL